MLTKAQAATGSGAAAIGAGGTAVGVSLNDIGDSSYDIEKDKRPNHDFTLLAWEDDYSSVYGTGTVGNKYAWYLTGIYGFEHKETKYGLDLKDNRSWWEWAFNRWKIDTYKDKKNQTSDFASVTSAYAPKGSSDNTALNRVCETIYKKKASEWTDEESLLRYCSSMGKKPVLVKDSKVYGPLAGTGRNYNSGTYGYTKKETLVSVSEATGSTSSNEIFFTLKKYRFFGKNFSDNGGEGNSLSSTNEVFYQTYQKRNQDDWDNVKEACSNAYLKTTDSGEVDENALEKYCTFDVK